MLLTNSIDCIELILTIEIRKTILNRSQLLILYVWTEKYICDAMDKLILDVIMFICVKLGGLP